MLRRIFTLTALLALTLFGSLLTAGSVQAQQQGSWYSGADGFRGPNSTAWSGGSGGYVYSPSATPAYSYPTPTYSSAIPAYAYSAPTYNYAAPSYYAYSAPTYNFVAPSYYAYSTPVYSGVPTAYSAVPVSYYPASGYVPVMYLSGD